MRIATYRHQNRRAVGRLSPDGQALEAFALGAEEERRGALGLENPVAAFREAA
jgi:hypothetical protein